MRYIPHYPPASLASCSVSFMQQFLLRLVSNAIALYVAAYLVNGIQFAENGQVDVGSLVVVALTFGIVNAVIKPIVQIVTCPAYVLTLGLFTFIVNAWMLILTDRLTGLFNVTFRVDGFWPAFLGAAVISLVSFLLSILISDKNDKERVRG